MYTKWKFQDPQIFFSLYMCKITVNEIRSFYVTFKELLQNYK